MASIAADTHLFGSRRGYECLAKSPGITAAEDRALSEFGFGQSSDERFLSGLVSAPTAYARPLPGGRIGVTRVLAGPLDDSQRPTLERRTLVVDARGYSEVRRGMAALLADGKTWSSPEFAAGGRIALPAASALTRAPGESAWRVFDAWYSALERPPQGVVVGSTDQAASDILETIACLSDEDAARFSWGIRLLSPISWVTVLSLSPYGAMDGRRQVFGVSRGPCVNPPVEEWRTSRPGRLPSIAELKDSLVSVDVQSPRATRGGVIERPQRPASRRRSTRRMVMAAAGVVSAISLAVTVWVVSRGGSGISSSGPVSAPPLPPPPEDTTLSGDQAGSMSGDPPQQPALPPDSPPATATPGETPPTEPAEKTITHPATPPAPEAAAPSSTAPQTPPPPPPPPPLPAPPSPPMPETVPPPPEPSVLTLDDQQRARVERVLSFHRAARAIIANAGRLSALRADLADRVKHGQWAKWPLNEEGYAQVLDAVDWANGKLEEIWRGVPMHYGEIQGFAARGAPPPAAASGSDQELADRFCDLAELVVLQDLSGFKAERALRERDAVEGPLKAILAWFDKWKDSVQRTNAERWKQWDRLWRNNPQQAGPPPQALPMPNPADANMKREIWCAVVPGAAARGGCDGFPGPNFEAVLKGLGQALGEGGLRKARQAVPYDAAATASGTLDGCWNALFAARNAPLLAEYREKLSKQLEAASP